jgi:hypothetical protein
MNESSVLSISLLIGLSVISVCLIEPDSSLIWNNETFIYASSEIPAPVSGCAASTWAAVPESIDQKTLAAFSSSMG